MDSTHSKVQDAINSEMDATDAEVSKVKAIPIETINMKHRKKNLTNI